MKNILNIIWLSVFSLLIINKNSAQYSDVGMSLGMATYWGDLNAPSFTTNMTKNSGIAIGAHYRYMFNHRFGLKASLAYGRIKGDDQYSDLEWQKQRNLDFKSHITEFGLMGEFYIFGFNTDPGSAMFAPYLTAGITSFWFDPKTTYQGNEVRLQPLGTEGQGMPGRPDKYKTQSFSIPFGAGTKIILTETMNIGLELVLRRSMTDYIDDISTVYINYDDLNAANGTLAANLGNRMNEYFGQVEPVQLPTGSQRGGAKVDDYYLMTMVSFNFMFTDWKGKRVLGKSNKVTCPTFN